MAGETTLTTTADTLVMLAPLASATVQLRLLGPNRTAGPLSNPFSVAFSPSFTTAISLSGVTLVRASTAGLFAAVPASKQLYRITPSSYTVSNVVTLSSMGTFSDFTVDRNGALFVLDSSAGEVLMLTSAGVETR